MGSNTNMHDDDPFLWLPRDDDSLFQFSIDELNAYVDQLPQFMGPQEDQQPVQGQDDTQNQLYDPEALLYGFDFVSTNTGFGPFPDFDFGMAITDNSTPTNTAPAWTPLGWSTSPGTDPSAAASDASFSSPSQISTFVPSPQPLAPRPIASALPHNHLINSSNGRADQQILQDEWRPVVTPTPPTPDQPLGSGARRTPRRRRDGLFISARERRKTEKPIKCPLCFKGHAYDADLRKHIAARHKDDAHHFGVSTAKVPCPISGCSQTLARPDHVPRHIQRKHKRP